MLKILAFADMHGSKKAFKDIKKKSKDVDLLVCAGDISIFERDIKKILKDFNNIGKPMILIAGNHESEYELKTLCKKYENIFFLIDSGYSVGQYHFICAEGNGFSHEDKRFEKIGKKFLKKIHKIRKSDKNARFILVTHAPPHKTKLDKIMGGYSGNKAIRRFIVKAKPHLALCGHIHENAKKKDTIGKTRVINPGPFGMKIIVR